jgi:hypothetical protein
MARNTNTTPEVEADEVEATDEEVTFSPKDLAAELNTDAKSFRRWLRSYTSDRANKGGRWVFDADTKATLIEAYNARNAPAEDNVSDDAS